MQNVQTLVRISCIFLNVLDSVQNVYAEYPFWQFLESYLPPYYKISSFAPPIYVNHLGQFPPNAMRFLEEDKLDFVETLHM